jgi:hypothetical protein
MKTISEFLQQNTGSTNASSEVFLGLRCLSLFMVLGEYSAAGQMPDVAKNLRAKSIVAFEFVKKQPPYKEEFVQGQVKMMVDLYTQRVLESKARTGSFSDDDVMKSDIATCGEVF